MSSLGHLRSERRSGLFFFCCCFSAAGATSAWPAPEEEAGPACCRASGDAAALEALLPCPGRREIYLREIVCEYVVL